MAMRLLRFIIPASFILVCSACGPKGGGESEEKAEASGPVVVELSQVIQRTMQMTVTGQGLFTAPQGSSVKVGAVAAGRLDKVLVNEGDTVSAGQLVALLDSRVQGAQTQSAKAALQVAELQAQQSELNARSAEVDQRANLKLAHLALESARTERKANVAIAKLNLQTAQVALAKAKAGNRKQEISQAEQSVRQAQVARDSAARDEKRNALLLEKGIVSKKAYEDAKTALANADSSLKSAQAQFSLMKEGTRKEDLQAAELAVQSANESLKSSKELGDQKVRQAEATLKQAQQGVLQVEAKRNEAEASLKAVTQKSADAAAASATQALTEIRSPITGKVSHRLLNPGDTPDNNAPILEIVSLNGGIDFSANVTPADAAQIKVGMSASINAAGTTDSSIEGSVISIGQVDPASGMAVARIHISAAPASLRIGTFGTAHIIVQSHETALSIPKSALLTKDDGSIVYVAKGDKAALVKVETGAEQDGFIEIKKGLVKGQSVVTVGNYELSDGGAIKTKDDDKKDEKKDSKDDDKKAGGAEK